MGRRVVHFANLPIKLLMPSSYSNIKEISLKTIPSATKIEIKRVLESLYGFEVERVETLNMEGKKKKYGGILLARPDYKKAYVTLKSPLWLNPDLFPIRAIEEEIQRRGGRESKSSIVEDPDSTQKSSHWLDDGGQTVSNSRTERRRRFVERGRGKADERATPAAVPAAKFPWSSMKGLVFQDIRELPK